PELFASLRPQTYTDAMERQVESLPPPPAKKAEAGMGGGWGAAPALAAPAPAAKEAEKDMGRQMRRSVTFGAGKAAKTEFFREELGIDAGVQSAASAGNLGDFFQYVIDHPVSLPRQKSAMLPIVNGDVEGTKMSIYNERTLAKHPLLGLRLKN